MFAGLLKSPLRRNIRPTDQWSQQRRLGNAADAR
jgi:hypothetical protein